MTLSRQRVQAHIERWSRQLKSVGLGQWPKYIYHFTDLRNAASVLNSGVICSRQRANRRGLMVNDNASHAVIAGTEPSHLQFARFYFRPKTPTQYRNEGIRSSSHYDLGSHCPSPVYFLFRAEELLTRRDLLISDGNMAAQGVVFGRAGEMFDRVPWEMVYHEGTIRAGEPKRKIIFHRHAEALVPDELPLDDTLRYVVCRSDAERNTLKHLLSESAHSSWSAKLRVSETGFFFKDWVYVDTVDFVTSPSRAFRLTIHVGGRASQYRISASLSSDETGRTSTWKGKTTSAPTFYLRYGGEHGGILEVDIEGCTAFQGRVSVDDSDLF